MTCRVWNHGSLVRPAIESRLRTKVEVAFRSFGTIGFHATQSEKPSPPSPAQHGLTFLYFGTHVFLLQVRRARPPMQQSEVSCCSLVLMASYFTQSEEPV